MSTGDASKRVACGCHLRRLIGAHRLRRLLPADPRCGVGVRSRRRQHPGPTGNAGARGHRRTRRAPTRAQRELLRSTVEIVTGICGNSGQAMEDLAGTLRTVRQVVGDRGMKLFCAGTRPRSPVVRRQTDRRAALRRADQADQWWGRQMLIWGVHVRQGSSAHKVMPIITSMLGYYPTCWPCPRRRRGGRAGHRLCQQPP